MTVIGFPDNRRVDVEWVRTTATDVRDWAAIFAAAAYKAKKGVLAARRVETAALRYGTFLGRYSMGRCGLISPALRIADGDGLKAVQRTLGEDIVSSLMRIYETIGNGRPWIALPDLAAFKFNAAQTLDIVELELANIIEMCRQLLGEAPTKGDAA